MFPHSPMITFDSMAEQTIEHAQPLTVLAEDERLFRDSVREFAERESGRSSGRWTSRRRFPRALIDKLFELGVMGIEIPETYGGAGASFFHSVLAVEELSRVDPSVGVLVDVQNTLVVNALLRWGNEDIKRRYLPRLAAATVGAYALSEAGSGSDAFALTTRARRGRRRLRAHRPQALDHQRQRGRRLHRLRDRQPRGRLPRHHRVHRRARLRRVHRRQEGRQARHPRQQHLRADLRGLPRAEGERARRGRQGLQVGDRDAERRAHRHRRADDRPGRRRARSRDRVHEGAEAVRQADRRVPGRAAPARARGRGRRGGAAAPSTTPRGCATPGRPFLTEAAICKIFSSEVAERVASLAVNLFGGNGFVKDYPVEKLYRDAKIGQIYEGTSNLQLQTIAKQILG